MVGGFCHTDWDGLLRKTVASMSLTDGLTVDGEGLESLKPIQYRAHAQVRNSPFCVLACVADEEVEAAGALSADAARGSETLSESILSVVGGCRT